MALPKLGGGERRGRVFKKPPSVAHEKPPGESDVILKRSLSTLKRSKLGGKGGLSGGGGGNFAGKWAAGKVGLGERG